MLKVPITIGASTVVYALGALHIAEVNDVKSDRYCRS